MQLSLFQFRLGKLVAIKAFAAILSDGEDKDEVTGSEGRVQNNKAVKFVMILKQCTPKYPN